MGLQSWPKLSGHFYFFTSKQHNSFPPPPLNNVGCPGLKYVSKILFSLSTSTLFMGGGGGGNTFLIFFSDLTLSALFLFHKKRLQKCQLSLNQLARIVRARRITCRLQVDSFQSFSWLKVRVRNKCKAKHV